MKIKALNNFAHASKRAFVEGRIYDVTDKSAQEFIRAGLAEVVVEPKAEEPKAEDKKPAEKKAVKE